MPFNAKRCLIFPLCCFLVCAKCSAQICSGSLGDPVVNINFSSGSNPGPPLPARLPNLNYVSLACPDDGFYTIVNSTSACFNDTWHTVSADHTPGDVNGYMMLVNASFNTGDFYVDTVKGLCGNTTYEFASWVLNVLKNSACGFSGINPNLVFSIESTTGVLLGSAKTGDIAQQGSPAWQQFGLFFKTPANASNVILRIANTAPGGCGNDIILDDITFRPCGPSVHTFIGTLDKTRVDQCAGSEAPVTLQATISPGYNNPVYLWQRNTGTTWTDIPGANGLSYVHQPAGIGAFRYRLVIAEAGNFNSSNCRIASNESVVTVHALPGSGLGSNSPVCAGDNISLNGGSGSRFSWKGPNGFSDTTPAPLFTATPAAAGKYLVEIADDVGCKKMDSLVVIINQKPTALVNANVTACEGDTVTLNASGGSSYQWLPANNLSAANVPNPVALVTDTIAYRVVVTNAAGCSDSAASTVFAIKKPVANAGPDKILFEGQSATLEGSVSGNGVNFSWSPTTAISNPFTLSPSVSPADDITYTLQAFSPFGCPPASDQVFVRVYKQITVPTAFSPNGDGINDTWRIAALITYPEAMIAVYDRYGQQVFKSIGYNPWDGTRGGKPVQVGTYYYRIDLRNGTPALQGAVFVIR